ncbi:hypothetical protein Taro_032628 [Colocasia esculenta]|uniref:Uncharacterized protein n=1 Tax=Colocasia esculenta TaxID=4460 RepID=A0A843VZL1_COLES|nr:hypothetical protein [Colocasia esculenta]
MFTRGRVKHNEWKVSSHDLYGAQLHLNTSKDWYTMYHEKQIPTKGVGTPQRIKPQPTSHRSQTTTSGKARVGKNDATTWERTTGS